jgi:hypothetical protein
MDSNAISPVLSELAADWEANRMSEEAINNALKMFSGNDTFRTVAPLRVDQYSFAENPFTGDDLYYLPPQLMGHCSYALLYAAVRDFAEQGEFIENFFLCHAAYIWRILNSSGTEPQRAAFAELGKLIEDASGLDATDQDGRSFVEAIKLHLKPR